MQPRSRSAPRRTSPGGTPWLRSITRAVGATRATTPWQVPTNSSSRPKSEMKTIARATGGCSARKGPLLALLAPLPAGLLEELLVLLLPHLLAAFLDDRRQAWILSSRNG